MSKFLIKISNDVFRADAITAIMVCDDTVQVQLEHKQEVVEFSYDDEEKAIAAAKAYQQAWGDALDRIGA